MSLETEVERAIKATIEKELEENSLGETTEVEIITVEEVKTHSRFSLLEDVVVKRDTLQELVV